MCKVNKKDWQASMSSGNTGMWVWKKHQHKYVNPDKPNAMKLNSKKYGEQYAKNKRENVHPDSPPMDISLRWVQKLWARHRHENTKNISHPKIWEGQKMACMDAGNILRYCLHSDLNKE